MKTTVELPDDLLQSTREYANEKGKTFKEVLIEALDQLVRPDIQPDNRPGWEKLFGAFSAEDLCEVNKAINEEFSRIDVEGWR